MVSIDLGTVEYGSHAVVALCGELDATDAASVAVALAWGMRRSDALPGWGGNRETLALACAAAVLLDQETLMFDAFMATAQAASSCAVVP